MATSTASAQLVTACDSGHASKRWYYQQVLFLDADNMAVRDPSPLFGAAGYNASGALLWPDYWESSAAPDISDVLGLVAKALPSSTFESGQMVLHKRRCGHSQARTQWSL